MRRNLLDARHRIITNMKRIMAERRIRPTDLARAMDINPSRVSHWLGGATFPTPESMDAIARVLGCDVSLLFEHPAHRHETMDYNALKVIAEAIGYGIHPLTKTTRKKRKA